VVKPIIEKPANSVRTLAESGAIPLAARAGVARPAAMRATMSDPDMMMTLFVFWSWVLGLGRGRLSRSAAAHLP
jgi:hypothetical protein